MGLLFKDALHDRLGTWPLAYIPYGGADFGEVRAVAHEVGDGDDSRFFDAWSRAAERLAGDAGRAMERGQRGIAAALWLRASAFYATAYHPLYGEPVDPRLRAAQALQVDAFDRAMQLHEGHVEPMAIDCEGTALPAYLICSTSGPSQPSEAGPLLILNNGYDATITDMYFMMAAAALQRGYHCLLFDGPGQGSALIRHGARLRPDWEVVIRAVVDAVAGLPQIDAARIALYGASLGGYLAPRAASEEHRLAACIADPGLWSMTGVFQDQAVRLGASPQAAAHPGELSDDMLEAMMARIEGDRVLRWSFVQRGFWTHGVRNLRDYLRAAEGFTMEGRAARIGCPTLLTLAEADPLAVQTQAFFEQLRCPKTLLRFSSAEGAGDHCEMGNRTLLNRRVLDWLDDTLARR